MHRDFLDIWGRSALKDVRSGMCRRHWVAGQNIRCIVFRLVLLAGIFAADPQRATIPGRSRLLNHMRQFVREETLAFVCVRRVLTPTENDLMADAVGKGVHCFGRLHSPMVRMNSHPAEIMPEARFHEGARRSVQRLAGRAENFMHNRRHFVRLRASGTALQCILPFLAASFALAARAGRAAAGAFALQQAGAHGRE